MRSPARILPIGLALVVAFTAPFVALACSDLTPYPLATSSGTGSTGMGGALSTTSTLTAASTGAGGAPIMTAASTGAGAGTSSVGSSGSAGSGGSGSAASSGSSAGGGTGGGPDDASVKDDSPANCGTIVTPYAVDPSPHIATCFPVEYSSNPPTSGPHYPIWAAFKTYASPIPHGFTVHDLQHGAIVISYKCAGNCAVELDALQAFLDARPADPACVAPVKSRIVVTPDPTLDVPFAAAAWGFALTSQCFDLPGLAAFIDAHYGMGPEGFCADGVDVTSPDAGIAPGCGDPVDAGAGPG